MSPTGIPQKFRTFTGVLLCAGMSMLTMCGEFGGPTDARFGASGSHASFSFAPQYPADIGESLHLLAMDIDNVHIVLRAADGTIALDTIIAFPPGVDTVSLQTNVILHGASEQLSAVIQLRTGNSVLYEGTQQIEAKAGLSAPQPVSIPIKYAGPGSTATKVIINTHAIPLLAGATSQLTATVTDAGGQEMSGVPLAWSSSDASVATVSTSGLLTALGKRGTATITAKLLSGLSDAAVASITLPATSSKIVSGNAQSGRAGDPLAQQLVVEVDAADGVGVAGITVNFRGIAAGASASPATGVTDASGRASTTLTLGGAAGAQAFEAQASPLTAITSTATAISNVASQVTIVSGNAQADTTDNSLPLPFTARVADKFGNAVSGATVSWTRVTGAGSVTAPSSTTDANGMASMTYKFGSQPGNESVSASVASTIAATFTATARVRAPSAIVAATGMAFEGTVGGVVNPIGVLVTNNKGQPVPNVVVTWAATGGATVGSPTTVTGGDGRAITFAMHAPHPGNSLILASFSGSGPVGFVLKSVVGPASQLVVVAGNNQSATAGHAVAIQPSVRLLDSFGNAVSGTVTFTATGGGGSVTGNSSLTDNTGLATVGSWTLGSAGAQTLTATSGAISVSFNATSTPSGPPPKLSMSRDPSDVVFNNVEFTTDPRVQLKTGTGGALAIANVPVTVSLLSGGQQLLGTLTVNTNSSGFATFDHLKVLGTVGVNHLKFTAAGYTSVTSDNFAVWPGAPTQMSAVSSTTIAGTVGEFASPRPRVIVKDISGNPVSGRLVHFARGNSSSGTVYDDDDLTDLFGMASPDGWKFGTTPGTQTLKASYSSVTGSPVTFTATVRADEASHISEIAGDHQTATEHHVLAAPVVVEARDQYGNHVTGAHVIFTVLSGGGTPTTQTLTTGANGRASFAWTLGSCGSQTLKARLSGDDSTIIFHATAVCSEGATSAP